jgi:3-phosphoshikimate 1-carboxyvinyltransferase
MLGADITYMNREGFPPLRIQGKPLQGGTLEIEAGISSQYISALLMIGPCMKEGLTLKLKGNIASRTYIELTLDLMRHYGATAEWADERTLRIEPGRYEDKPLSVEGDWSGASYWYELAAVAAHYGYEVDIRLHGMREDSRQGDRVVAQLFEELGVKTEYAEKGVELLIDKAPCGIDNSQFSIREGFHPLPRHCPNHGCDLLPAWHALYVHRHTKPAHQGDRPCGGAHP